MNELSPARARRRGVRMYRTGYGCWTVTYWSEQDGAWRDAQSPDWARAREHASRVTAYRALELLGHTTDPDGQIDAWAAVQDPGPARDRVMRALTDL